jgi:carbon-monoxide dehydrogenase large subunit
VSELRDADADAAIRAAAPRARIGEPVRRKEDFRLVTGRGRYTDDVNLPGQAYAVMVRSPHAHARIGVIDATAAMAMPGVLAVLTGRDLVADGLKPIPHKVWSPHPAELKLRERDGFKTFTAPHYPLPQDKARFVGEAVAMVVATSLPSARDGAERVAIDYEVLPAVTDTVAATHPDVPLLFDEAGSNVVVDGELGDEAATTAAFARAAHVVRFDTWVQRVAGVPMEPRAALCEYDAATARYTLYAGSGGAWRLKDDLATILAVPADRVRVLMWDVGGNFGTRGMIYAEFALVAWAARRLARPVKWTADRHEAFLADYQGRDLAVTAELALDRQGNFLALRSQNISNAGAHTTNFSPLQKGAEIMTTVYRVPVAHVRARALVTNTAPTRPYRSAGRPEVMYVMERLIDLACREHGFDRAAIRRRNLIRESEFPYTNALGMTYDSGAYHRTMEMALKLGDWDGFAARRKEARRRGRHRGIAVGGGAHSGRGMRLASQIMWKAANEIIARGKQVAALLLQTKTESIAFADGRFAIKGTGQAIGLIEVAAATLSRADLPDDLRGPLTATCDEVVKEASFPFGSHVCEVEIDPALGTVDIVKYSAVDDVGRAVNPMIIDGQTHGGIAQGLGQALMEQCFYDAGGQLLSGSFMDYAMPRADALPFFDTAISETPTPLHPLGIRPAGEGGTTPALAVTINAIVDALRECGVRHVEMPATPERIWRAMRGEPRRSS